ncbi:twin-arginine translocation signal domain-containing protein [Halobellus inordinatus]|uniref:twin-arginine translocation signal domain-containing protein n=1 Tax=Halobellus inordinatus TaxID=1126236 RepID=UPI002114029A|nr:twin-arginine translocation signal domain-containing protein [Halobellus ramosii]
MRQYTRRSFLQACGATTTAGALALEGTKNVHAISTSKKSEFETEQARYISKFATTGKWAFEEFVPLFDPPSNKELGGHLVDSVMPSVTMLLPGLVGQAVELKQTLSWYDEVGKDTGFRTVSRLGPEPYTGSDPSGDFGSAMDEAATEVQNIADGFDKVNQRAQRCVENPSQGNLSRLAGLIETLIKDLDDLVSPSADLGDLDDLSDVSRIAQWANINPSPYGNHPDGKRAAKRVKENAKFVLDTASAFRTSLKTLLGYVQGSGYHPFPAAIVLFNQSIGDIRSSVPNALFDRFAGDSFNIRIEDSDGKQVTKRWLKTSPTGNIKRYKLEDQNSADAEIALPKSTVNEIVDADDSMTAAVDAYESGDIQVSGNGLMNSIKYSRLWSTLIGWIKGIL